MAICKTMKTGNRICISAYHLLSFLKVRDMIIRPFLKFVPPVGGHKFECVVGRWHEERLGLSLRDLHLPNPHLFARRIFHYPGIALFFPQLSGSLGYLEDLLGLLLELPLGARPILALTTPWAAISMYWFAFRVDHDDITIHTYHWLSVRPQHWANSLWSLSAIGRGIRASEILAIQLYRCCPFKNVHGFSRIELHYIVLPSIEGR
jgi:hypothetical protein